MKQFKLYDSNAFTVNIKTSKSAQKSFTVHIIQISSLNLNTANMAQILYKIHRESYKINNNKYLTLQYRDLFSLMNYKSKQNFCSFSLVCHISKSV